MATTPRFDLIGIVTSDMAATLAFYRRLGLDIPAEADGEPHVEAPVGSVRIAWDTEESVRSFAPDRTAPPHGTGRINLAFLCDSPAEVDTVYEELTGAGHEGHMAPWDAFWGQRYAVVLDPDGNGVDLFAATPS